MNLLFLVLGFVLWFGHGVEAEMAAAKLEAATRAAEARLMFEFWVEVEAVEYLDAV